MPVNCSQTVITGQDGSVYFQPAGTEHCLLDFTDFQPAGTDLVTVPATHDFREGDQVIFRQETINGVTANLDSALVDGQVYTIGEVGRTTIQILNATTGDPVTLAGDGGIQFGGAITDGSVTAGGSGYLSGTYRSVPLTGGTGKGATADITVVAGVVQDPIVIINAGEDYTASDVLSASDGNLGNQGGSGFQYTVNTVSAANSSYKDSPGTHINVSYASYQSVCNVRSYTINMTRDRLETTSIPCGVTSAEGTKYSSFRTYQPGYADGTGSMEVQFSRDTTSIANRLLANSMLKSQDGAWVKLYIDLVPNQAGDAPDDVISNFIEAPISIEGFDMNANTTDITTGTLNFSVSGVPTRLFTINLA